MGSKLRVARPRTRAEIEELAWQAREATGLRPFDRVPVAQLMENVLPELIEGFEFRVAAAGELGAAEAVTDASEPIITFDEKAYSGLYRDYHRYRMTAVHELGHLLMHTGKTSYAFMPKKDARIDVERQADIFASAFLMPECAFKEVKSIRDAMSRFGVSKDAACCRARTLRMNWLISGKPAPKPAKKKGYSKRRTP